MSGRQMNGREREKVEREREDGRENKVKGRFSKWEGARDIDKRERKGAGEKDGGRKRRGREDGTRKCLGKRKRARVKEDNKSDKEEGDEAGRSA